MAGTQDEEQRLANARKEGSKAAAKALRDKQQSTKRKK